MSLVIRREAADSEDARSLLAELDAELAMRYPAKAIHGLHPGEERDPQLIFLIARADGEPLGCGALRPLENGTVEIKRMFVRATARRRGISRAILDALEGIARDSGYATLVLETGTRQPEALTLYRSAGYVEREPYGEYVGNPFSVCMTKPC
jgi:GNAT superfamily N-acetyltransferase